MEQQTGRTGVTFEQVATAADAIAKRGDRPTLRGVRAELGRGSMGTIQKHLSEWQGRHQVVASRTTLSAEVQRVILSEIEREVGAARAELEAELSATVEARDTLADDNEQQAEQIEQQTARLYEIEAASQQQAGRIAQLDAELSTARQATERERLELAKAELRLEALPRLEAEAERLRAALDAAQARAVTAEQLAAVTAEKLAGAEARLADALARSSAKR